MRTKDQILLENAYTKIQEAYHKPVEGSVIDVINPIEPNVSGRTTYAKKQDDGKWYSVNADDNTIYDIRWMVKDADAIRKLENHMRGNVTPSNSTSDYTYAKKGGYVNKPTYVKSENFIHGIQPISEAKKKVNPYAVCTATVGRKDESKYKSCKEKVVKGAKKAGKKVATEKVKNKKKK